MNPYRKGLQCLPMANRIESYANDSLQAWILLGQTDKYDAAMNKVRVLRHAEGLRTISERREYLNVNGIFF